jgi:uncharacterized protein (TIGR04255 family)
MANPRAHLNRAPIREALIDITIEPRVSLETIKLRADSLAKTFSKRTDIWEATFGVSFDPDGARHAKPSKRQLGFRFDSSNPPHVLQARVNGFTFSRLSPYEDWFQLRAAAQECWSHFAKDVAACRVTRIAVRYINALKFPMPIRDFSDLLEAAPQVPADLPQGISNFIHQVAFEDPQGSYRAVVTQALESANPGEDITVLLDIEVNRNVVAEPTSEGIWNSLDDLRTAKNRIFFSHLTERAVDIFA